MPRETFLVEGLPLCMLVMPLLYIADLLEAWPISGLRSGNTSFPDIMYMVPRKELTETTKTYHRRDVRVVKQVCTLLGMTGPQHSLLAPG